MNINNWLAEYYCARISAKNIINKINHAFILSIKSISIFPEKQNQMRPKKYIIKNSHKQLNARSALQNFVEHDRLYIDFIYSLYIQKHMVRARRRLFDNKKIFTPQIPY